MCGDGANDCCALNAAHVGVSLSDAESSVASPFTSKKQDIACVPKVIKEGRAALTTSFGVFKIMVCYSLTELASVIILYNIDANLSSPEFLFIDVFLILNFSSVFGLTKAYPSLSASPPSSSLLGLVPVLSMVSFLIMAAGFQTLAYVWIQSYDWFTPFVFRPNVQSFLCYENYAVFSVSMFQYIAMAVAFSKGKPYRRTLLTNKLFTASIILTSLVCFYISVCPHQWLTDLMEIKMPPMEGRITVVAIGCISFLCSIVVEKVLIDVTLERILLKPIKNSQKVAEDECQNRRKIVQQPGYAKGQKFSYESERNGDVNKGFISSTNELN